MLDLRGDPYRIEYLYHLTSVDNLASIIEHGLLSHNRAYREGREPTDISLQSVNDRRGKWHDYAPLYFNPKNPMLYRRQYEYNIAIIFFDRNLIFQNGVVFTDGNAAHGATKDFNDIREISKLDWQCIHADRYNTFPDGRRKRCAEVLIPDMIPPQHIEQIAVRTRRDLFELDENIKRQVEVVVRSELYF